VYANIDDVRDGIRTHAGKGSVTRGTINRDTTHRSTTLPRQSLASTTEGSFVLLGDRL